MARELYVASRGATGHWNDSDAASIYGNLTGYPVLRDRFGFLNQFSRWRLSAVTEPFPASDSAAVFADLMDARAAGILAKVRAENRQCYIFLSGGVDSTALTIAMLKAAAGDYSNLCVAYNAGTVYEYPAFVYHLKTLGIPMREFPPEEINPLQAQLLETDYVLTGWAADQLFGSIVNQQYPDWFFRDWRNWLRKHSPVKTDKAIQQLEAAFSHYGLPINNFGEFAWFMNFACKYRIVTNFDALVSGKVTHRMISFYDTPEFQSWSISSFDVLHQYAQQDAEHYKIALKDYIYEYNHDADYRINKGKVGSWANSMFFNKKKKALTASFCVLEDPDTAKFSRYYKPLRYGERGVWVEKMTYHTLRLYRKK